MLSWGWGYVLPIALLVCLGAVYETSTNEETNGPSEAWWIKQSRASIKGDVSALDDFWDENADYVGVDGTLIKGRAQMQAFVRKVADPARASRSPRSSKFASLRRNLRPWMVRGRLQAPEVPTERNWRLSKVEGLRPFRRETVNGRFIATREMVIFK